MAIDWSKYGITTEEDEKKQQANSLTSASGIDWSKYETPSAAPATPAVDPRVQEARDFTRNTLGKVADGTFQQQLATPPIVPAATPEPEKGVLKTAWDTWVDSLVAPVKFVDRASAALATALAPKGKMIESTDGLFGDVNYSDAPTPRERAEALQTQKGTGGTADKVADFIGEAGSFFAPVGGAGVGKLYKGASDILAKYGTRLSPVAKEAAREAIVGAPLAVQQGMAGDGLSGVKQDAIEGAALGAAGGAAVPLLGAALRATKIGQVFENFMNRGKTAVVEPNPEILALPPARRFEDVKARSQGTVQPAGETPIYGRGDVEVLGLPESQRYNELQQLRNEGLSLPEPKTAQMAREAERRSVLPTNTKPILGRGDITPPEPLGLPAGNYTPQQRLKVADATTTLNSVMQRIKPVVVERMTPPYENANELAKWVRQHLGIDNISLNEVRAVPYEDLRQMAEMILPRLSTADEATKAARELGFDLPALLEGRAPSVAAKQATDAAKRVAGVYPETLPKVQKPVMNKTVTGHAAMPETKVGLKSRMRKTKKVKSVQSVAPAQSVESLEFKRQRLAQMEREQARRQRIADLQQPEVGTNTAFPQSKPAYRERMGNQKPIEGAEVKRVEVIKPKSDDVPSVATAAKKLGTAKAKPADTPAGEKERGFVTTLKESDKPPAEVKDKLSATYTPISNERTVAAANKRVKEDIDKASGFVMGKSILNAEKVATAHRLIDEFTKQGKFERAVDIAEKIAEEGTKAGQSIQAFSIYNRLSAEGILIHATRNIQRVNEKLPVGAKEVKLTPEIAANLTDLTNTVQQMTGVKNLSNNVLDIVERAKNGAKLTDSEEQTIKQFIKEAKQFVKEVEKPKVVKPPKPPAQPKDRRVRDNVVSFLDAQEARAKERLRAKGIQISATPLDVWADYAIIGAAKLGKGIVKFSDWSESMVKDLGEEIRPHLRQLYERASETFTQTSKRISQSTISEAERMAERMIKSKNVAADDAEIIRDLAQRVSGLSGDARVAASQDLHVVLNKLDRPTLLQKISTVQTIAHLLNPKTLLTRNPLGNELFYRLERLNKLLATPFDIARSKLTKTERYVTFKTNNQGEYWKNFIRGAVAGWKGVNPEGLATQFDIRPSTFSGKWNPLTYMEKALGASLKAFDYAAYKRAVNETIGELATLRAINAGKPNDKALIQKYIREADENILRIADEYGKYVTFQDNNIISVGLQKLKRGLNVGKDWGVGDLIIKYPRTPGALLMRALEYSPAGFLRSAYVALKPWLRKGADPDPAEAVHAFMRGVIGTGGLMGFGVFAAQSGLLTGQASKDRDIRALAQMAGQGQYQINLSAIKRFALSGFDPDAAKLQEGDQLYSYDWAQPVAVAISMGADMIESIREKETKGKAALSVASAAAASLEGGVNTLVEQSVLQGIRRAAEGYPGQSVMDKITSILSDIPSTFVPTAVNQVNQLTDNRRRETYDPSPLQQAVNRLKVKVPGLSQQLPQQYDTLGKPKEIYQDNSNNLFNVLLNPGFAAKYKLTPEAKLVVDLIAQTGDETLAPRVPGKSMTVRIPGEKESKSQKLTPEQFSRLQQLTGEETAKRLGRINPAASNESKIKQVAKALNEAGERARAELKREMGVR